MVSRFVVTDREPRPNVSLAGPDDDAMLPLAWTGDVRNATRDISGVLSPGATALLPVLSDLLDIATAAGHLFPGVLEAACRKRVRNEPVQGQILFDG